MHKAYLETEAHTGVNHSQSDANRLPFPGMGVCTASFIAGPSFYLMSYSYLQEIMQHTGKGCRLGRQNVYIWTLVPLIHIGWPGAAVPQYPALQNGNVSESISLPHGILRGLSESIPVHLLEAHLHRESIQYMPCIPCLLDYKPLLGRNLFQTSFYSFRYLEWIR